MFDSVSNGSSSTPNSLLAGGNMSWLAGEDYQHHNISWSSGHGEDIEYRTHNVSTEGSVNSFIYEAVIQGILVCLFTTVGGVMILVFCLIMIQECKILYLWAVRTHSENVQPPSYMEVTKPPSYSSCGIHNTTHQQETANHTLSRSDSPNSQETEPPAYSDLYTRENSELDRLVICDGVGTLVHAATMDAIDWNMEEEEPQFYVDNHVTSLHQDMSSFTNTGIDIIAQNQIKSNDNQAQDNTDSVRFQPCSSMFTIETPRPEKKRYRSLQIFKFGSISSSSSSITDSVPLLDDVDSM